jgi:rRNA maturation RNase YbeY
MLLLRVTQRTVQLQRKVLLDDLEKALRFLQRWPEIPIDLSDVTSVDAAVWCASDATVRQLNATYRHQRRVTDVLSFAFQAPPRIPESASERGIVADLGTVVIATPFVYRRYLRSVARDGCSETFHSHLLKIAVHGLCHLFGYRDETEHEWASMQDIEQRVREHLHPTETR